MPQDQFNPLFADDPEFFEHGDKDPEKSGYFAPPSELPDHYENEWVAPELSGPNEGQPVEFSIPEGPTSNPQTTFEPTEVPEGSTVDLGPPVGDHYETEADFGDPDRPEEHTIEPPEREDVESSAMQYGPMDDPEEAPERPSYDPLPSDHTTEAPQFDVPDIDAPREFPSFQSPPAEAQELPIPQAPPSDNLFQEPMRSSQMYTYSPPWM